MVGWLSLFLSVCFLNGAESTNGPSVNALSLKIKAEKNRIIPFEPVFLSVTISNMAATPISLPGRWRSSFRFQVRDSGVGEWRDIREWWKPSLSQPPLPAVSLNANEVQTRTDNVIHIQSAIRATFRSRSCVFGKSMP